MIQIDCQNWWNFLDLVVIVYFHIATPVNANWGGLYLVYIIASDTYSSYNISKSVSMDYCIKEQERILSSTKLGRFCQCE